jgi:hypothetical protein
MAAAARFAGVSRSNWQDARLSQAAGRGPRLERRVENRWQMAAPRSARRLLGGSDGRARAGAWRRPLPARTGMCAVETDSNPDYAARPTAGGGEGAARMGLHAAVQLRGCEARGGRPTAADPLDASSSRHLGVGRHPAIPPRWLRPQQAPRTANPCPSPLPPTLPPTLWAPLFPRERGAGAPGAPRAVAEPGRAPPRGRRGHSPRPRGQATGAAAQGRLVHGTGAGSRPRAWLGRTERSPACVGAAAGEAGEQEEEASAHIQQGRAPGFLGRGWRAWSAGGGLWSAGGGLFSCVGGGSRGRMCSRERGRGRGPREGRRKRRSGAGESMGAGGRAARRPAAGGGGAPPMASDRGGADRGRAGRARRSGLATAGGGGRAVAALLGGCAYRGPRVALGRERDSPAWLCECIAAGWARPARAGGPPAGWGGGAGRLRPRRGAMGPCVDAQ